MHKIALLSIAVLASLAGAAIGQTAEPEPAWRAGALAMVPSGYVAGEAYRTVAQASFARFQLKRLPARMPLEPNLHLQAVRVRCR